MTRRRVLLVSPPVLHAKTWWANRIANKPHLASLAGYVRNLADVEVLEMDVSAGVADDDELARLDGALGDDLGLVGISCWTSLHYLGACAVAERVRRLAPHVPIVVGGHHATAAPDDFSEATCDWLVQGDGEYVLRALCEEWPRRPPSMRVLVGRVFDQSNPTHIDWDHYGRANVRDRALWVGMSRGCAFKCHFCVEPQRGATYSRYAVEAALAILERLVKTHAPRVIAFSDPLFGANRRWTEAFLDGIERRALPLMFWAETRADLMTPALLESFKRCRFMLDFGLDAASATMVERMAKAADPDRYLARSREILDHANAIGLHHGVYLIFNYPGETPASSRAARRFIEAIGGRRGPMSGWLSCQAFFILPGTAAFARMAEDATLHGTEIRNPRWWTQPGDHHALATDVLPSAAWHGREDELRDFVDWNHRVNARWAGRYPADVLRFRHDFYTA